MNSNLPPRSDPQWPPEATDGAAWPPVPGVDGRLALRALRGDVGRYTRLLQVFARHHAPDVDTLRALCAPGADLQAARRCLHGLKGSASTVGATGLHALAVAVDTRLHHGEPPAALAADLQRLADDLQRLIDDIGALRTG
jgi:HPt (histidine-containing phosphotransfer) domain-containing protein